MLLVCKLTSSHKHYENEEMTGEICTYISWLHVKWHKRNAVFVIVCNRNQVKRLIATFSICHGKVKAQKGKKPTRYVTCVLCSVSMHEGNRENSIKDIHKSSGFWLDLNLNLTKTQAFFIAAVEMNVDCAMYIAQNVHINIIYIGSIVVLVA